MSEIDVKFSQISRMYYVRKKKGNEYKISCYIVKYISAADGCVQCVLFSLFLLFVAIRLSSSRSLLAPQLSNYLSTLHRGGEEENMKFFVLVLCCCFFVPSCAVERTFHVSSLSFSTYTTTSSSVLISSEKSSFSAIGKKRVGPATDQH